MHIFHKKWNFFEKLSFNRIFIIRYLFLQVVYTKEQNHRVPLFYENFIKSIKDDIKFKAKNRQKEQKPQKDEKQIFPKNR